MKNKNRTIILLTLVISIWGILGFNIVSTLKPTTAKESEEDVHVEFSLLHEEGKDTFSIGLVVRDPFLGAPRKKVKKSVRKNGKALQKPLRPPKPEQDTSWAPVIYRGLVKTRYTAQRPVFVVDINNRQHLLKAGETIDGMTLVHGDADKVRLRHKEKLRTFSVE